MRKSGNYISSNSLFSSGETIDVARAQDPTQIYFSATDRISELASLSHHTISDLADLHTQQQKLRSAEHSARASSDINLAARIAVARISSNLWARREFFIQNHHNPRIATALHELLTETMFHELADLTDSLLDTYDTSLRGTSQRAHLSGVLHELGGLLISHDPSDPLKFGLPASAHDDQISSGFRFDMMLYNLNRKRDMRRAIDMKSWRHPHSKDKISQFARTSYSDEILANGLFAPIWDGTPYQKYKILRTNRALIDSSKGTTSLETEAILTEIRDQFYRAQFKGHREEVAERMATHTLDRYVTSGTANRT